MRIPNNLFALATVVAVIIGGCATTPEADSDAAAQLRKQADAWDQAIVRKDAAAIASNMADSFRQIDSQGNLSDKPSFVSAITSDRLVIFPYQPEDVVIRLYGATALITGTTSLHGTWDGKPFTTHYRYTDTYVRSNGTWRVVNVQTTEMAK